MMLLVIMQSMAPVHSHMCVFNPRQRGGLNISDFGDPTCFKFKGPCGSLPSGPVQATFQRGKTYNIDLQQNLNHYSVGHPGWLDVSVASGENPDDSQFTVQSVLTDYFPVRQWTRTNLSIPLYLNPQGTTGRHVIRVRYNPNKPTEPIFHQCIDIMITPASSKRIVMASHIEKKQAVEFHPEGQKFFAKTRSIKATQEMVFGVVQNQDSSASLVGIDILSGQVVPVLNWNDLSVSDSQLYSSGAPRKVSGRIINSVTAVDNSNKRLFYLFSDDSSPMQTDLQNSPANKVFVYEHAKQSYDILKINITNVQFNATVVIPSLVISGLFYESNTNTLYATALFAPDVNNKYTYYLGVFSLTANGAYLSPKLVALSAPLDSYVDYLWTSYDASTKTVSVLIRHEDEPVKLPQKLFSVVLGSSASIQSIDLDPTQFVYSSIHSYKAQLFAFSPGNAQSSLPSSGSNTWSMIGVDRASANQEEINQMYDYQNYLGGGITSAVSNTGRGIYNIMHSTDGKDQILVRVALKAIPIGPISEIAHIPIQTKVYNWARMDI
ncbi:hypothetical protein NAEGRDRAFT_78087 [Naegleria gruberi]|uniref:Uncharacterized protein n=1 Tax=Naegleria gruberi TaxID=5762 RepID=D2V0Y7_NAEGR|nr:uncharacterized protein NAEGRDRAFT_78087 [Naegleria gruberi]EFC49599.1 hypothetical protein NAEGRDRAFT_78087 [Naegleria gruberi]|eukprot:XP_002682343.1 hypothetical protein NAEGRDRAFT_78087 [Naegleria gruberi strain NEG-M]